MTLLPCYSRAKEHERELGLRDTIPSTKKDQGEYLAKGIKWLFEEEKRLTSLNRKSMRIKNEFL